MTEELYEQTFGEIEEVISELNTIIGRGNFDGWKRFLTQEYIDFTTDPANLKKISDSPILKENKIVLRDLRDYFQYVVRPSRSSARLDRIEMLDNSHVKALTVINDVPILLYWLVKIDGEWKIGIW